jgi:hypothetical protein
VRRLPRNPNQVEGEIADLCNALNDWDLRQRRQAAEANVKNGNLLMFKARQNLLVDGANE